MKKALLRLLSVLPVLMVCILCTACTTGGVVDTTLEVTPELSGTRTMAVTLDSGAIQEHTTLSIDDIDALTKKYCPGELDYSLSTDANGEYVMNFVIKFNSIEEYNTKVSSLYSGAGSEITGGNTVWFSGISATENFSSCNLLEWLTNAIISEGLVTEKNSKYILGSGKNSLSYNGNTYSTSDVIKYDNTSYVDVIGIDILTEVNKDNSYNRIYRFHIDSNVSKNKEKEVKEFLSNRVSSKAKISTENGDGTKDYIIKIEKTDAETISSLDGLLFTTGSLEVTDSICGYFGIGKKYTENFSVEDYTYSDSQKIEVGSKVKVSDGMTAYDEAGNNLYFDYIYTDYLDADSITAARGLNAKLEYSVVKDIPIAELDITTEHKSKNKFKKTITFTTAEKILDEEAKRIADNLNNTISSASYDNADFSPKVSSEAKSKYAVIKITANGTATDLERMTKVLTGKEATLAYSRKLPILPVYDEGMIESFDFTNCISVKSEDFKMIYTVDMGMLSRIETVTDNKDAEVTFSGHKAVITNTTNLRQEGEITGYRINQWEIIVFVLLIAALATALFIVIKKKLPSKNK